MDKVIEEGNKIIAEFMGLYVNTESYNAPVVDLPDDSYCYLHEMEYHSRWDQLMPVVEKIESIGYQFKQCRKRIEIWKDNNHLLEPAVVRPIKGKTKIESTWLAVVDFIQRHNDQKQP